MLADQEIPLNMGMEPSVEFLSFTGSDRPGNRVRSPDTLDSKHAKDKQKEYFH